MALMVEIKNLGISFGGLRAVSELDMEIKKGELYGLIGPNGAGKTTVFNLLTGVYHPDTGSFKLDGEELIGKKTIDINKAGIARTFQNIRLFKGLSVLDNVKAGLHNHYRYSTAAGIFRLPSYRNAERQMDEKAMELLKVFELDGLADHLAANLPYGQQRKLEIARALATDPKVLLCDEATSALDPKTTHDSLSLLRELHAKLGITILLITHQMSVVEEICTRVAILDNGSVVEEGPVESVFSAPKSAAAKRLVFPDGYEELPESETPGHRIRVVFRGTSSATAPLIARMAIEEHILANILAASIKSISGKEYGPMVLEVADADECARALAYLAKEPDLVAEEVNLHA